MPRARLNYRLSISCHDTIVDKCADACSTLSTSIEQPCGGTVSMRFALTEKMAGDAVDAECQDRRYWSTSCKMEAPSW